ncbi:HlyD family secretion protein [Rhizobium mayense]|uniref:HlyD family secretion protein n=1 Tax=Rhizobium mayense TaxID=1312184 RepID=UPI0032E3E77F
MSYQAKLDALKAKLALGQLRVSETTELRARGTGRADDVEQAQVEVEQLRAGIAEAKWNLDKTVALTPADGCVTNLALRKGALVANLPLTLVMAFIDSAETIIGVEIPQIDARYVDTGQPVEVNFKFIPGKIYTGQVESVLQVVVSGQTQISGTAVNSRAIQSLPLVIRVKLDDTDVADQLAAGSTAKLRSTPIMSRRRTSFAGSFCGKSPSSTASIHSSGCCLTHTMRRSGIIWEKTGSIEKGREIKAFGGSFRHCTPSSFDTAFGG